MPRLEASTPDDYIAQLPPERREAISAVRDVIRKNLPPGFPDTYNGRPVGLAAIASQKNHMSVYLNSVYGDRETEAWFKERYAASGKKLDMGKSCVRFRRLEDLPLHVIGEAIARTDIDRYLEHYQAARGSSRSTRTAKAG